MIKKKGFLSLLLVILLLLSSSAAVFAADQPKDKSKENIVKVDFIHYKDKTFDVKPGGGGTADPGYKLMGVQWPSAVQPVNVVINPLNSNSFLTDEEIRQIISDAAVTWDTETASNLFIAPEINTSFVYGQLDGTNAISFGRNKKGIIAVTSVWYNRATMNIVEFDMQFNTYYKWGINADPKVAVMDLQNIAAHELGHAVGLADIYSTTYARVTMYGYSNFGDVAKRDLEPEDIIGLEKMYGM